MKPGLLSLLACPRCGGDVAWAPLGRGAAPGGEPDGFLTCPQTHRYPVIEGVPRFLDGPLFSALRRRYPGYFAGIDASLWDGAPAADGGSEDEEVVLRTVERFGYEWTRYASYDAENFARFLEPVRSTLRRGMMVLDAGCGAGRHLKALADAGMDVVGVDVSWAVEAASRRVRDYPRAYVVQADLCRLPFRRPAFDFVYSLGVLHHLPDPARGVAAVVRHLRPEGLLLAWVYMRTARKVVLEPLRRLLRVVPSGGIDGLSLVLAAVEYGLIIAPYVWLCRVGGQPVLGRVVPRRIQEYARLGFRVSRTDWYDRLAAPVSRPMTLAQARALLALPELYQQRVTPVDDSWWQCYARRRRGSGGQGR